MTLWSATRSRPREPARRPSLAVEDDVRAVGHRRGRGTRFRRDKVAIPYLQQAIVTPPDKHVLARAGTDLAGLRAEDTIAALLDSPLPPARDHKRSTRTRVR